MTKLKNIEKVMIAAIMVLIILISGTIYINLDNNTQILLDDEAVITPTEPIDIENTEVDEKEITITAYICGYVNNPGNITVADGTRLGEALELVGGALEEADLNVVNLAHKLSDEEMVYIPKVGETIDEKKDIIPGGKGGYIVSPKPGKININKATQGELEALPGVGPSTAQKILNYRINNGGFKSVEDIMNVPGIGEKKYESLKDFITI